MRRRNGVRELDSESPRIIASLLEGHYANVQPRCAEPKQTTETSATNAQLRMLRCSATDAQLPTLTYRSSATKAQPLPTLMSSDAQLPMLSYQCSASSATDAQLPMLSYQCSTTQPTLMSSDAQLPMLNHYQCSTSSGAQLPTLSYQRSRTDARLPMLSSDARRSATNAQPIS